MQVKSTYIHSKLTSVPLHARADNTEAERLHGVVRGEAGLHLDCADAMRLIELKKVTIELGASLAVFVEVAELEVPGTRVGLVGLQIETREHSVFAHAHRML